MGPVAERLGLRPPAPAEFVRRGRRKRFALHPIPGEPFLVGRDNLDRKGHRPRDDVRTVFCNHDLLDPGIWSIFHRYSLIASSTLTSRNMPGPARLSCRHDLNDLLTFVYTNDIHSLNLDYNASSC